MSNFHFGTYYINLINKIEFEVGISAPLKTGTLSPSAFNP